MKITKRNIIGLILACFICSHSYSSEEGNSSDWRWDYFKLSVGAEFLSALAKRGATFYESYQVIPIYSLDLFHPDLQLVGTSLFYKYRVHPLVLIRNRFSFNATGDKPLYTTGKPKTARNERESTMEWDPSIEIGFPTVGEFTFLISQDVKAHGGSYFESKLRAVVANLELGKLTYQPALFASIGAGTQKHNTYLYGAGADGFGLNNYSVGFSIAAPPTIDHIFPVLEVKYYGILGTGNKTASLTAGKVNGWQVIALFAFKIFET